MECLPLWGHAIIHGHITRMLQRMDCGKRKGIAQELLKTGGKCKALILVCRHFIYLLVCSTSGAKSAANKDTIHECIR